MAMNYTSLGHVAMRCKDYEKMRKFYVEKLGCEELFHLDKEDGSLWLTYIRTAKGQFIELFPESYEGENDALKHSHHHFCFEVDDFAGYVRELQAKGVVVHNGPVNINPVIDEPVEERKLGMCCSLCAFIQDPEGNDIEIMQFTETSLQIVCDAELASK